MIRLLLVGMFIAGAGCPHPTPPPEPPPAVPSCATACARMQALGCEAGQPTPRGEPCTTVCANVMGSGIIAWDLACMTRATSCSTVDACNP